MQEEVKVMVQFWQLGFRPSSCVHCGCFAKCDPLDHFFAPVLTIHPESIHHSRQNVREAMSLIGSRIGRHTLPPGGFVRHFSREIHAN